MRSVIIAGVVELGMHWCSRTSGQALLGILLMPAQQALQSIVRRGEHIPHIVKNSKTKSCPQIRQRNRRKSKFQVVNKQCRPTDRKSR